MVEFFLVSLLILLGLGGLATYVILQYRNSVQEAKNYERGLKMVPLYIHIPPASDDLEKGGRDERDVTEEVLSQAQVMYNIISSTATSGFRSKIHGQRHISFEIVSHEGLVHYYTVVPTVLVDVIRQAVIAAYPSARLEEVEQKNIFSQTGKIEGTVGGELTLRKDFAYPIATYRESKRDASRAMLNALSSASKDDGIAIQILIRPADEGWTKKALSVSESIKKDKGKKVSPFKDLGLTTTGLAEALWKPPQLEEREREAEDKQLTSLEQSTIEQIEEKTRYPGYEALVRVVVSSTDNNRANALLKNIIATFSLFDSPSNNGFKFTPAKNPDDLVTAYLMRFFPQRERSTVLNSVEMATVFHLPDQNNIPTSRVKRQMAKQVDGPTQAMDEGFLIGYNEFRGVKKPIRLATNDRRRHTYFIGQTGVGKSVLLENLAYQDMIDGKGFAFIDPHGDAVENIMGMVPRERVEDIIYFNPSDMDNPIGLNLFEFETEDQRDFLIQEAIAMLYKLYDPGHTGIIGPRYEHWFRNAALTIMSDPNGTSFIDVPQVFNDQSFTDSKMQYVKDQTVLDFWNKEMAQTSEANKSEVLGWFVSKFGAFLSNEMMRNVIGQTKSGFNIREIMDNNKILLVNLSKGKTGELNSQLLGMMFVMKFQVAAMGRADMPEDERKDFALYVDEFQNFATDSFESILSEARKYRLNLILANQFMTQLTETIREAILGNIGTIISGRIGVTDAELLQKKFLPTFNAEDLTKLPNYQAITSVMISGVPSSAFSMSLVPPMGESKPEIRDALKKLSAVKYGRPRAEVEQEIFARLGAGEEFKRKQQAEAAAMAPQRRPQGAPQQFNRSTSRAAAPTAGAPGAPSGAAGGKSFLDEWLERRAHLEKTKPKTNATTATSPQPALAHRAVPPRQSAPASSPATTTPSNTTKQVVKNAGSAPSKPSQPSKHNIRHAKADSDATYIKLR